MKTYKINQYIELKLESDKTNIYVNGNLFKQCKYVLMNIDTKAEKPDHELLSIDELKKQYSSENEHNKEIPEIDPKTEFFAHCSNLEAWINNDYNPHLLHSNLSVPLLRELVMFDVKVLSSLIYHLDSYWIDYALSYDKRFTKERRMLLVKQYGNILFEALDKHNLFKFSTLSVFLNNVRLIDILPKMFPFSSEKCEFCDKRKIKMRDQEPEFVDVLIHNDPYDLESYTKYRVCQDCYDNLYDNDYEYCQQCGNIFENSYNDNVIYIEAYEEYYCTKCLNDIFLESGIPEFHEYKNVKDFAPEVLKFCDWQYLITLKMSSERDYDTHAETIKSLIESENEILIMEKDYRYYRGGNSLTTLAVFIKRKKPFWNFKHF